METTEVYIDRYRCLINGKEFNTAGFARDLSQEWGQKYYVTEDGEASIVDLINAKPAGMTDLDRYVELLWADYGPRDPLNGKAKVQQAAWRFFADLSRNGKLWYFETMDGHPVCGKLIMHKVEEIETQLYINAENIRQEMRIEVVLQPVTFTKWLGLTDAHKRFFMEQFLASPEYYDVRTLSDPIYPHPFHPEMSV